MAHVHGFFPGEFCLFEDLFEEKKKRYYQDHPHVVARGHKGADQISMKLHR